MKKIIFCFMFNLVMYCLLTNTVLAWSSGPPAYRAGAPDDKGTCNTDDCHNSFPVNSGSAKFSITAPDFYTPGKFVKIKISFSNTGGKLHGFEMTALDADGNRVGTFKKIGNTTQVISPNDYRELMKSDKGKYIEHTFKGMKKKSWVFKWKPPGNAAGTLTFYAAGSEANGNGTADDDYIYTTTMEIDAAPSTQ